MPLEQYTLHEGTLLYHGTSTKTRFEGKQNVKAPAWFSTSEAVARRFRNWNKGPCPRILVYYVSKPIHQLAYILVPADLEELLDEQSLSMSSSEMAEYVCEGTGYNGWYIPHNYLPGDDIMLCDTSALEFVRRICP